MSYKDKKAIKVLLDNYATKNNFNITAFRSNKRKLYHKYQKGGSYRNTCNLNEDDRGKLGKTTQSGCPYMIRLCFRSEGDTFFLVNPNTEYKSYHSHSLTENNLLSTINSGRRSALTQNEAILANGMVVSTAPVRNIQRTVTGDDNL